MLRSAPYSATPAFCKNKYSTWASLFNVKAGGTYSRHRSVLLSKLVVHTAGTVLYYCQSWWYIQQAPFFFTVKAGGTYSRHRSLLLSKLVVHTAGTVLYYCCPNMVWIFVALSSNTSIIVSFGRIKTKSSSQVNLQKRNRQPCCVRSFVTSVE
jgi:hypothetical protein